MMFACALRWRHTCRRGLLVLFDLQGLKLVLEFRRMSLISRETHAARDSMAESLGLAWSVPDAKVCQRGASRSWMRLPRWGSAPLAGLQTEALVFCEIVVVDHAGDPLLLRAEA